MSEQAKATKQPSYEQNIKRLEAILQDLERGELPLEQALALFEEGVKLIRTSSEILDAAEQKVFKLLKTGEDEYQAIQLEDGEI